MGVEWKFSYANNFISKNSHKAQVLLELHEEKGRDITPITT